MLVSAALIALRRRMYCAIFFGGTGGNKNIGETPMSQEIEANLYTCHRVAYMEPGFAVSTFG